MVESYLESNKKKKSRVTKEDRELKEQALKVKEDMKKFKDLVESELWKSCKEDLKEEIYNSLSYAPSDGDSGKWWLMYGWAIKACIERIEGHAKKYDDAVKYLSK